jgi:hypothetical protein
MASLIFIFGITLARAFLLQVLSDFSFVGDIICKGWDGYLMFIEKFVVS